MEVPASEQTIMKPVVWTDLPVENWIKIVNLLEIEDIKNLHLVCRKTDEISTLYYPRKLSLTYKHLLECHSKNLIDVPYRYYKEVELFGDFLFDQASFKLVQDIFIEIGLVVEKLLVSFGTVSRFELYNLLSLLPNLKSLAFDHVGVEDSDECWKMVLPKLKTLRMELCDPGTEEYILNNLQGFSLTEVSIRTTSMLNFLLFLKDHERSLKKMSVENFQDEETIQQVFGNLDYMRLEELQINSWTLATKNKRFLRFLGHQSTLKVLRLKETILSDAAITLICECLKSLQVLELQNWQYGNQDFLELSDESFDRLYKLKNLKKLVIDNRFADFNTLSGLVLGVNKKLVELEGNFEFFDGGFLMELPKFVPNLRSLKVRRYNCTRIDHLKHFEQLEHLEVQNDHKTIFDCWSEKVAWNVKHLEIQGLQTVLDPSAAENVVDGFPNLEYLKINWTLKMTDKSMKVLLMGLKKLKVLILLRNHGKLSKKIVNSIKLYGENLKEIHIDRVYFDANYAKTELMEIKGMRISTCDFDIVI